MMLFLVGATFAQEQQQGTNHWRLSWGLMNGSSDNSVRLTNESPDNLTALRGMFSAEWSRTLNQNFELGVYAGLKDGSYFIAEHNLQYNPITDKYEDNVTYNNMHRGQSLMLGLTGRVHLLPLTGHENSHWDLYLSGRAGAWFCSGTTYSEYGFGMGVNYFPTRHFGLFAENNWGVFNVSTLGSLQKGTSQLNLGIIIR